MRPTYEGEKNISLHMHVLAPLPWPCAGAAGRADASAGVALAPPFLLVPSMESEPPGHRVLAALGAGADAAGAAADGVGQRGKAGRGSTKSEANKSSAMADKPDQGRAAHGKKTTTRARASKPNTGNARCVHEEGEDERDTRAPTKPRHRRATREQIPPPPPFCPGLQLQPHTWCGYGCSSGCGGGGGSSGGSSEDGGRGHERA
jgi:hypothetical protein